MILIAELISHFVNGNVNMATIKKTVKKAQRGVSIGSYMTMNPKTNQLNRLDKFKHSDGDRYYRSSGPRDFEQTIADENMMKSYGNSADSVRSSTLTAAERKAIEQKNGGKTSKAAKSKMKAGGMLKRADGSYSKRGLWDNIRANKGSGKKPTAAMLKQERKIKAKSKK